MTEGVNKIFCVGLPKTGMHSMKRAFEILGYNAHRFVCHFCDVGVFDSKDAFCDYPVYLDYKILDKEYPGSKFILTEREVEDWLASSEAHSKRTPSRPHNYKLEFFGAYSFDEDLWRKAYWRHLKDVKKYFSDRQEDLLEMNLPEGDGWEKLCNFLGHDIPSIPFPHLYSRR